MATASAMASDTGKMSFAKVVASASAKESAPSIAVTQSRGPTSGASATTSTTSPGSTAVEHSTVAMGMSAKVLLMKPTLAAADPDVAADLKALKLAGPPLSLAHSSAEHAELKTGNSNGSIQSQPSSDEVSQKADSSSELGTKPPSLDGKSITSGTTFNALDEKESLRPDDSASVKAAADEDDAFSIRGSHVINSRLGSDVALRMHRIQIGDMPPRTITRLSAEPIVSGAVTPHSGSSEQQAVTEARVQLATNTTPPDALNSQNPDEKLLEAMQTQKDRLFLLRLENEVVNFVQNSKEPFMDLPPCNSFCRMLTHKLADYYHMTHSFEAVAGSVRIYRTPFCRVPPALASLVSSNASSSDTPPPVIQPRKIMRRGEEGELLLLSAGPSKPTSEADSDSKDKSAPSKEPLTREAREEAYNKARERIFGNSVLTETSTPENDDGTGVSRASSVSAKERAASVKKGKMGKQRRDDSESFDSRSQYTPYYNHPQQPTWIPPQYMVAAGSRFSAPQMPMHQQQPSLIPQPHPMAPASQAAAFVGVMQPQIAYGSAPSGYPPMAPGNGIVPPVAAGQQFPSPSVPARYPAQPAMPSMPYGSAAPNTAPQPWQQQTPPFNPAPFATPQARTVPPSVVPYAYGQLPVHVNPNDPKSQHPIPGSYAGNYNRHAFNPQTQSFVPGSGAMPVPGASPPMPYGAGSHGPMAPPVAGGFPNGAYQQPAAYGDAANSGYAMMRQGSNASGPTTYPPQPPQPPMAYQGPAQHGTPAHGSRSQMGSRGSPNAMFHAPQRVSPLHNAPHGQKHHGQHSMPFGPKKPGVPHGPNGGAQGFSYLPNYGNPATLPQKPTTSS